MRKIQEHWQILIAILFACLVGLLLDQNSKFYDITYVSVFAFFGTLFLNALKMIVIPLVVSSIIVGVHRISEDKSFGRLGIKTLSYYLSTTTIAILIGIFLANIIEPGVTNNVSTGSSLSLGDNANFSKEEFLNKSNADIASVFLRMIPENIFKAAADGQLLGLIFFCFIFGFFSGRIHGQLKETFFNFWQGVFDIMISMTNLIMKVAPIGVFALVAKVIMISGAESLMPLLFFFITVLSALLIHMFVVMPCILKAVKANPISHFRAMFRALLTAFSTSSSSATLPITIRDVKEKSGVSNRISSFVLPLGATVNMDGTALYECIAVLFIAQVYGIEITVLQQIIILLIALTTSIGVAGIPAASLVAITIILTAVGLPVESIGLILAVDRILDMFRTSVNVFSDSVGAVVIAKTEGEKTLL
ncbi:MAG: dicarboxylate/amino acid:cation symporter [Pseudomonadota bacterium]